MKYNDLIVESNTRPSRKGRGISAGQGKTAGRGTKGQKARTGHRKMPTGFMGGQRAIMQAVPKLKGFKSLHAKAEVVYTDRLNGLTGVKNLISKSLGSTNKVNIAYAVIESLKAQVPRSEWNTTKKVEKADKKAKKETK